MILSLLSSTLVANTVDKNLLKFEEQRIKRAVARAKGTINSIKIVLKKDLKQDGWYGYVFNLDINIQGNNINQKDTLFAKGNLIAPDLISTKTKRSFKDMMYPTIGDKYYSKKHLIAGNPNAKHKMVIFSDPLCPICVDEVPFIIKAIIDNPKNIALYYYHLPLDMHPTARTISKASIIARKMGIKNVDYRVYDANFSEKYKFDAYEDKDDKKILKFFNKEFGTNITMGQINDPKLEKMLKDDNKMSDDAFVSGTPTVFFDGNYDITRLKYEQFLK
ncbi:MAG: thioredoxin domain-containing protein [Campylobacterota bacterium]|nr:thioredoxin domain-containing protein [Campylobacterota bacterium]